MDIVTAGPVERIDERYRAHAEESRPGVARVAEAMKQLGGYIRRQPDITLGELRAVVLGSAFEWGVDGTLGLSPTRMALVREFDDLIRIHGWGAPASDLVLMHRA